MTQDRTTQHGITQESTTVQRTREETVEHSDPPLLRPSEDFAADAQRILTEEHVGVAVPLVVIRKTAKVELRVTPGESSRQ